VGLMSLPRLSLMTPKVPNHTSGSTLIRSKSLWSSSWVTSLTFPATTGSFAPLASPTLTPCAESLTPFGRFAPLLNFAGNSSFELRSRICPAICGDTLSCHAGSVFSLKVVGSFALRSLSDGITWFSFCSHVSPLSFYT